MIAKISQNNAKKVNVPRLHHGSTIPSLVPSKLKLSSTSTNQLQPNKEVLEFLLHNTKFNSFIPYKLKIISFERITSNSHLVHSVGEWCNCAFCMGVGGGMGCPKALEKLIQSRSKEASHKRRNISFSLCFSLFQAFISRSFLQCSCSVVDNDGPACSL